MIFTPPSSPARASPPRKREVNPDEKLLEIPEIDSYDASKQVDAWSNKEGLDGLYKRPDGCSCDASILDCRAHHHEAASITGPAPRIVGGPGVVFYDGPMPGLNRYGDVPNPETSSKAARRQANRGFRQRDPERYAQVMEVKKAIRDDYLRSLRLAGLS